MIDLISLGKNAKNAAANLLKTPEIDRNRALKTAAKLLRQNKEFLMAENAVDIENARQKGVGAAFIDRLALTEKVIEGMAVGLEQVS